MSNSVGFTAEDEFSLNNRRRLSGPGLRTFLAAADQWDLTEEQRIRILGMPLHSSYQAWCRKARSGRPLVLCVDVLMRISAVLGIYGHLQGLHESGDEVMAWLHGPHVAAPYNGRAPIALMTTGSLEDLMAIRSFLAAAQQGFYMAPNEIDNGFIPYRDEDIRWV
ncbi:MAG: hypothetical protein K0S56_1083 [Microvirga sp.]|jgi:hypothetical protein|nr:hypothetical protein [Microvirga sp.]